MFRLPTSAATRPPANVTVRKMPGNCDRSGPGAVRHLLAAGSYPSVTVLPKTKTSRPVHTIPGVGPSTPAGGGGAAFHVRGAGSNRARDRRAGPPRAGGVSGSAAQTLPVPAPRAADSTPGNETGGMGVHGWGGGGGK